MNKLKAWIAQIKYILHIPMNFFKPLARTLHDLDSSSTRTQLLSGVEIICRPPITKLHLVVRFFVDRNNFLCLTNINIIA